MSDDNLNLPPNETIPVAVLDRVRGTVQQRIRRSPYRTPALVAAGVAILAAGAVVLTTGPGEPAEPARPIPSEEAMNRCWAAIQQTGKTTLYPDRSTWKPAIVVPPVYTPQSIVAISGKTSFVCVTSDTTVTVSDPTAELKYAEGSKTAALLVTESVVAGVIDPSWPAAMVAIPPHSPGGRYVPKDGLFVVDEIDTRKTASQGGIRVAKVDKDWDYLKGKPPSDVALPQPAPPAITIVDRPVSPPPDRTSDRGKFLGDCMPQSENGRPVLDQDSYAPGASAQRDDARLVMARSSARVGGCSISPVSGYKPLVRFSYGVPFIEVREDREPVAFYPGAINTADGARETLGGSVPMKTARMQVEFENGTKAEPDVANGTFAMIVPDQVVVGPDNMVRGGITAKLLDAKGGTIYSGPLNFYEPPK